MLSFHYDKDAHICKKWVQSSKSREMIIKIRLDPLNLIEFLRYDPLNEIS